MKYEDVCNLINYTKRKLDENEQYINSIPPDIRAAFFDNEYVENLHHLWNETLKLALDPVDGLYQDITWFIHEWFPGAFIDNYRINTNEDYYSYLNGAYKWD